MSTLTTQILKVHHVGSTAVPDLLAKPIIDVAIEATDFPPSHRIIAKLAAIGYAYKGESGVEGRHWFIKGNPRKLNVHYCAAGSAIVIKQLTLKERLIANGSLRKAYELLKTQNAVAQDIYSPVYAGAKNSFIEKVLE